ncbi:MAG TPA: L,D-transpeptidase [Candidatus Angelobacter sp.]|nr:L,D-transpeptidase [Candidatus Angelobacter sp.]
MRRLVAISSKTSKVMMALAALTITCTSLHLAASARMASLRRQQEALDESAVNNVPSPLSQSTTPAGPDTKHDGEVGAEQAGSGATQPSPAPVASAAVAFATAAVTHKREIVISIADRKLALLEDGRLLKTYPIAVGTRGTPSPDGDFVIINHAKDPVYRHGDKEIGPGKDNPLGSRWMGLSLKGYGIHGTNVQSSVGKAASHGCFRMRKQDVEELYSLVQVGDVVAIRRERDAMIAQVFASPIAPATTLAAQVTGAAETQIAAATVTTVETAQQ